MLDDGSTVTVHVYFYYLSITNSRLSEESRYPKYTALDQEMKFLILVPLSEDNYSPSLGPITSNVPSRTCNCAHAGAGVWGEPALIGGGVVCPL